VYIYIYIYCHVYGVSVTGSGLDDWIYWPFFTITINYDSSDIELLLNDVCLANLSEESLTAV
jgi:hypothetical protein